jgi:hypothetical protein
MEVIMKNIFFIILLILILFSCKKEDRFYDVDGPKLNFTNQIDDENVVVQFDEPVKDVKCTIVSEKNEKTTEIKNKFPTTNIYLKNDFFPQKKTKLILDATDTANNNSVIETQTPMINKNPVILKISEIQLKYSKTKDQFIGLKSITSGNISGFSIGFYINSNKYEFQFKDELIKAGSKFIIFLNSVKNSKIENTEISFSDKSIKMVLSGKLPQQYSLIYIKNNNDEIVDYLFYYDSKNHPLDYFESKKNFKNLISILKSYEIEPIVYNVNGNTVKKHIKRSGDKFIIN